MEPIHFFFQFFGVEKCNINMGNLVEFTLEIFFNFLKILV
jgi:hypothetical protein